MVQSVDVQDTPITDARGAFPIVGVGASAGGLSPTGELLRGLGEAPGIAVVIIHHLDPTHESRLVEILSRQTPLPVAVATDGVLVEPNRVYVMPPNAGLLIVRRILKVVPREEHGGLHLPINRFFESLALDCDGLAVGVILSGSGFDGTEGIKAIKREGGITLAQDATAQYGSMPESAIATGCVDFILPPEGLARELGRLAAHGLALRATLPPVAEEQDYHRILLAMRKASGVDFTSYKSTTIRRRMERRLFFRGLSQLSKYAELIEADPAELAALCEDVLIHVTGFFRDASAFEALRTQVFPRLCEGRRGGAPIRVWVPGCSTGEEVRLQVRRAIDQARSAQSRVRETNISLPGGAQPHVVTVEIIPFFAQPTRQRFFLVHFEEVMAGGTQSQEAVPIQDGSRPPESAVQQELESTRQYLESVIEQLEASNEELKAANEEIVSSNEELRIANEELQSAKEELQATNEELHTLNDEMRDRSIEAMRLSDDLANVLSSVEIPILIVGRDFCLRRFTPSAGRLFNLVAADLGRPVGNAKRMDAIAPHLTRQVQEVLQNFSPAESTIQDEGGRWFQLAVRPYVTLNGQIDGTVISARDTCFPPA